LDPDHYLSPDYFQLETLFSMAHQVRAIHALKPKRMLEIGVGNGFVSTFMRRAGVDVVTADINPQLNADICCPMSELPSILKGESFDLVSCCEVLEHMPLDQLDMNLSTLQSLATNAFVTLPGHFPWMGLTGRLGVHNRFLSVALGVRIPVRRRFTDGHFWEVNSQWTTRRSALVKTMAQHFNAVEHGVFSMHRYHYYFRCLGAKGKAPQGGA